MNSKNELQHLLQINKQKLPLYEYNICKNKIICTVFFEINNNKIKIEGDIKNNKKEASKNVALKACRYIINNNILNYVHYKKINKFENNYNKVVLVDIENVGYKIKYNDIKTIGFISKQHSLYSKINEIKKYMNVEVYDGKEKNGADTLMTFYVGKNIEFYIKNKIEVILLSKDHFVKCVSKILDSYNVKNIIQDKI